jgi:alpha-L-fucosidase 2
MKTNSLLLLLLSILTGCSFGSVDKDDTMSYHFDKPAGMWEETFPLGNGRIGMMPDGNVDRETIVLNDISMWSGSVQDSDNPQAAYYLLTIRRLLFEGRNAEAQQLMYDTFVCKGTGSNYGDGSNAPYGSYQIFGNMVIDYFYPTNDTISDYVRSLNLRNAIVTEYFKKGNTSYNRKFFTSFADDIAVTYLSSNVNNALDFEVSLNRPENAKVYTEGDNIIMEGQLPDGVDTTANKGIEFYSKVKILLPKGGKLAGKESSLRVENATEAIIITGMGTSLLFENLKEEVEKQINSTLRKGIDVLTSEHSEKYSKLFSRVDLNLGKSGRESLPINERLYLFSQDGDDISLPALYFQFGRYLLISSTREGLMPPNLQGLWCNTIHTPWNGDYHLNINFQMNHWPAEVCNLSELHKPLIEWTKQQVPSGEKTAKAFYNSRGWVTHILGNPWQFTAPGEHPSWGATNTSAAWLCEHLYTHFQFSKDTAYLRDVYPTMKGAALFFVDMLVEDPRSKYLVTAPTTSPENGYKLPDGSVAHVCAGSTMDNQIVRELFNNTIEAANILGEDESFVKELEAKKARLMPTTIAKDGRIMEWLEPFEEVEPHHRHVSHLYGLYPGNEISVELTPELAEAAKKTLEVRGNISTGWSMGWKINFWARLHDGDHAYSLIKDLLRPCVDHKTNMVNGGGTYPNLFCAHPPFQIDGNFGGTAGIAEMLIQSQTGTIELLPALPKDWKNGSFSGLKVRGGGVVDVAWKDGKIETVSLTSETKNKYKLKLPTHSSKLAVNINQKPASIPVREDDILEIELNPSDKIDLYFN